MTTDNGSNSENKLIDDTSKGQADESSLADTQKGADGSSSSAGLKEYNPRDQYKLMLSGDVSVPGKRIMYWLLRLNVFPVISCLIFAYYYPPQYNYGVYQSIFLNFFWLLQVYSISAITVLLINLLWCFDLGFDLKLAYKYALPYSGKTYAFALGHLLFVLLFFTVYGCFPIFFEWLATLGHGPPPDLDDYIFWAALLGYFWTSDILKFFQHIILRIFVWPTQTESRVMVWAVGVLWLALVIAVAGGTLFLSGDKKGFKETEAEYRQEYSQWLLDGKPQFLPWDIPFVSLPTPKEKYKNHLLVRKAIYEATKEEDYRKGRGTDGIQKNIDKLNKMLLDFEDGRAERK